MILFSAGAGRELYRVSAGGGVATPLPADGVNVERYWPSFLPDGRHFVHSARPQKPGIYVASLDSAPPPRFLREGLGVAYASGHLVVLVGSTGVSNPATLLAQPFDATRLELTGDASPIADQVEWASLVSLGACSVSGNGRLIYGSFKSPATQLIWFDRGGKTLGEMAGPAGSNPSLSPDGKTVAVTRDDPDTQTWDLWLIDTARGAPSRFTFDPGLDALPVWSPDGARIVYTSSKRGTPPNLYQKAKNLAGGEELLLKSSFVTHPNDWSPDGRFIVYASLDPKTQWDLWLLPMSAAADADRKPVSFLQSTFNEHLGQFSPDGRWLAYVSDESGTNEVYVRTFPKSDERWRISTGGGGQPKWRGDGRELFYLAADGQLMVVTVKPGSSFEAGAPTALFKTRIAAPPDVSIRGFFPNYTVTRDGERFLINTVVGESNAAQTTIVLNWPAAIRN